MHKLKEISIEAHGGLLTVVIFENEQGSLTARISGQLFPLAPEVVPGKPIPTFTDQEYGPVELSSELEQDLLEKVKRRIETDIGRVIRIL